MGEETLFESEHDLDRGEAATVLASVAAGLDDGTVRLADGDATATVGVPDEVELSVELERGTDDDGEEEYELELELEFDAVDAEDAPEGAHPGADDAEGTEADTEGTEVETDTPDVEGGTETAGAGTTESDAEGVEADAEGAEADTEGTGVPVAEEGPATAVVGDDGPPASKARFEVYRDRGDKWRWRLVHRNGNTIATGGQGYTRRHNAEKGLRSVVRNAPGAPVERTGGEDGSGS